MDLLELLGCLGLLVQLGFQAKLVSQALRELMVYLGQRVLWEIPDLLDSRDQ
jgi:hypothetical protein